MKVEGGERAKVFVSNLSLEVVNISKGYMKENEGELLLKYGLVILERKKIERM
ncbi:MAG TPA: hypothetical protein PLS50_08485 [Candidatus Dojkabacteria bacterium]|nr:hypothetical protein [Candidatus Dojkabacteria bacterium]